MQRKFEDVLALVGQFGLWQWSVICGTYIGGIFLILHHFYIAFGGAEPDHWCSVSVLKAANWSDDAIKSAAIPSKTKYGEEIYDQCTMYDKNYTALLYYSAAGNVTFDTDYEAPVVSCYDGWDYDTSIFTSTMATEWNLVCDKSPMVSAVQSWYLIGVTLGALIFGCVSDKYGRQTAIRWCCVLTMICTIGSCLAPNYTTFALSRFLTGFSLQPLYTNLFLLVLEVMSDEHRTRAAYIADTSTAVSRGLIGVLAYYFRDWHHLLMSMSLTSVCFFITLWLIPESPRWLLVKGRVEEAQKELGRAARLNKREIPNEEEFSTLLRNASEEEQKYTAKSGFKNFTKEVRLLFSTPEMRRRMILIMPAWFTVGLVGYGLGFTLTRLPFNMFLAHILNGSLVMVVRVGFFFWPLPDYTGRRWFFLVFFVLGGVAISLLTFVPKDMPIVALTLALALSVTSSNCFTFIFQYASEMYPTEVRNTGVGIGSVIARIGGIVAPFVVLLLGNYHEGFPNSIYGALSIISGLLFLALPETNKRPLPETVEDVEKSMMKGKEFNTADDTVLEKL